MPMKLIRTTTGFGRDYMNNDNYNLKMIEDNVNSIQNQIGNITAAGDSSPEASAARVGYDGTDYTSLKQRLDEEFSLNKEDISLLQSIKADRSQLDSLARGLASGSPKAVFKALNDLKTSFPSGSTGIYLVSDDGKWYYWSGTEWVAGGVYQSTGIADLSIKTEQISKSNITPFDIYNLDTINILNVSTATKDTIINNNGTTTTLANYYASDYIKVSAGEVYVVTKSYSSQGGFYDSNKTWISAIPQAQLSSSGGYKIVIPTGISYMRINFDAPTTFMLVRGNKYPDRYYYYGEKFSLKWINQTVEELPKQIVNMENIAGPNAINMFDKTTVTSNKYIDNNGTILDSTTISLSNYISIIGGSTYTVSLGYSSQGGIYDKNKTWIGAIPHPSGTTNQPATFTLPSNAYFVRINVVNSTLNTFMMVPGSSYPQSYSTYGVSVPWLPAPQPQIQSKWREKKWGVIGDSITEKNFRTTKNYHDYIADKINCSVYNYGVSGTGWRTPSGSGALPIYQRVSAMDSSLDLITVFAGTNDWGQTGTPLVMGNFGDTDPAASFYGAIDNVLTQLIAKYPTKIIAVFTPLPRGDALNSPNSSGIKLEQVTDAIIKVANKYSIPVLDLYRKSSLFPWNDTANDYYFKAVGQASGDRLHPNDAGHQQLADKIFSFLNTL